MPSRVVEFHPDAEEDARGAREWYAERSALLARAFLTEFISSVQTIAEAPERWPRYLAGTRRYFLSQFPFSLIYRVTDTTVVVVAVAHHRRKPGYWTERK